MTEVVEQIGQLFRAAGADGYLHAREIGVTGGPEVSVAADSPVVLASVFKIVVAVAYAREVAAGRLDETERTTVGGHDRIGGVGTADCADDVQMSWRDLALFMMTLSDNAATDVIYRRIGQAAVDRVLSDLGLKNTRLIGGCEELFATIRQDCGIDLREPDGDHELATADPAVLEQLSVLDPARTTASTSREITALLDAIWTNRAAPPEACSQVRSIMERQIWPHRLSSGFPAGVQVAAKTGTLPGIRNEAGVVTYPDGRNYVVAVFTRADSFVLRQPLVDASIGHAARLAVDHLRGRR
jgi:beta-lactamase class A